MIYGMVFTRIKQKGFSMYRMLQSGLPLPPENITPVLKLLYWLAILQHRDYKICYLPSSLSLVMLQSTSKNSSSSLFSPDHQNQATKDCWYVPCLSLLDKVTVLEWLLLHCGISHNFYKTVDQFKSNLKSTLWNKPPLL